MTYSKLVLLSSLLIIPACQEKTDDQAHALTQESSKEQVEIPDSNAKTAESDFSSIYQSIDEVSFKQHVKMLFSDEFSGREPATEGGRKTTAYIAEQFKKMGLAPGNIGSYFQQVPLLSIKAKDDMVLQIGDAQLGYKDDFIAFTSKPVKSIELKESELVFVGYGVVAPEYNWNDYADIDMKGKTAVILINDPGFATDDPDLFQGKSMTYYGRWTYKYEEAARQGAAGAIIIHQTAPASYGWDVVANSWSGTQYNLASSVDQDNLDVQMWLTQEQASSILIKAGLTLDQAQQQALKPDFKAFSLQQNASITLHNEIAHSESANVIATLIGNEQPEEHVFYMGHWDHLGQKGNAVDEQGKPQDNIYNGALDNATGIAGILSIAKAFTQLKQTPKRSITFMALTAEEQGLLGSKYFADHPTVATKNIIGAFNIDSMNMDAQVNDLTVVGFGKSELDEFVTAAAKRQNRTTVQEAEPEKGGFYRSDHFSLAKKGVPAIFAGGGTQLIDGEDKERYTRFHNHKTKCYHQLCDEYQDDWVWQAALDDVKVFLESGYVLSNSDARPNWYEGTEFKTLRDKDTN